MNLMSLKFNHNFKKVVGIAVVITMLLSFSFVSNAVRVEAKTTANPPATAGLQVNVIKNGTPEQVANYSIGDLKGWTQHQQQFTSIDAMPAPVVTVTSGIYLSEVLSHAGISSVSNVASITLYATDGWYHTYTYNYLYGGTRSYYPNLVSCWDYTNQIPGAGTDANSVAVQPMFGITSYQSRYLTELPWNLMDGVNTLRFCFGQLSSDISGSGVNTTAYIGRWINRMDVTLNSGVTPPATNTSPLPSPILSASYTAGGIVPTAVGQAVNITFTDNSTWRSAITGIDVNGSALSSNQYSVASGQITINSGVFTAAGVYSVVVHATGYTDDYATQIMGTTPPALISTSIDQGNNAYITFTDNSVWRAAITGVSVNGNALDSGDYTISAGQIVIDSSVFSETGYYPVVIKAAGYADDTVTQIVNP